jgi:hypothetical protein
MVLRRDALHLGLLYAHNNDVFLFVGGPHVSASLDVSRFTAVRREVAVGNSPSNLPAESRPGPAPQTAPVLA